jgi:hypothetical protein
MNYWIDIEEYEEFKIGDTVKRNDGATDYKGNVFDSQGPIIRIQKCHTNEKSVIFIIANKGKLDELIALRPYQTRKIEKDFKLSENGKMKLF